MGFSLEAGVPAITVFLQGILSFFSPCVLPLVPLYIGYLAGGTQTVDENGVVQYKKSKVMLNTLFFVIGVSFAFFALGFGFTAAGQFFSGNRMLFARIGGVLIILFGLYQLGVFGGKLLQKEHKLPFHLDKLAMNPLTALLFGFTFSFAWTPCVGPALASVLLMASSAESAVLGFLLIGVYTLGFILPFLAVGLFTSTLLDFFKRHQKVVKYTVKVGGVLLILMGVMMVTGWANNITGYLSRISGSTVSESSTVSSQPESSLPGAASSGESSSPEGSASSEASTASENGRSGSESSGESGASSEKKVAAPDFTFYDQYGESHTLSDYKGKTVFLNFWATWCNPCKIEMPDIQKLYEEYGENEDDLVVLGIANPGGQDISEEEIKSFLSGNNYTYPVVMDTTGEAFNSYGVHVFPSTYMIDKDGNVFGYVTGTLSYDVMESIVKQTMTGKREK